MSQDAVSTISVKSAPVFCTIMEECGLNLDISITCEVTYEFIISNVEYFSGKFAPEQPNEAFEQWAKMETDSALISVIGKIAMENVSYQKLQQSGEVVAENLSEELKTTWDLYGVEICGVTVSEIRTTEDMERQINMFANPSPMPNPLAAMGLLK